jgi:hypothetical protein
MVKGRNNEQRGAGRSDPTLALLSLRPQIIFIPSAASMLIKKLLVVVSFESFILGLRSSLSKLLPGGWKT